MPSKAQEAFTRWMNTEIANHPHCPTCGSMVTWCSLRLDPVGWQERWTCGDHVWWVVR
jgi:hypothetical protein